MLSALVILPGAIFLCRPDVFQGHAALRDLIAFPGNLLWRGESLLKITPIVLLIAVATGALLLAGGGRRLKKMDIV